MSFLFTCRNTNNYILAICDQKECDWFIDCRKFCNCTFVASHYGPFSNAEVGLMMNLTGERVRQIERKTLLKLKDMKEQGLLPHVEFDNEDLTQEIIL